MSLIELQNIDKTYRLGDVDLPVLKNVSLSIRQGEFVALIGASGSGKTTLMNLLGCLDQPTAGCYQFEGREVTLLSRQQLAQLRGSRIGFVFQSFNLMPRASALDNVRMPSAYSAGNRAPGAPGRAAAPRRAACAHGRRRAPADGRARVAAGPFAGAALRRRAAARGHRPRLDQPADPAPGRRAHRKPRLADGQGDPGNLPPPERRAGDHDPAGDARPGSGAVCRSRDPHRRRPDRRPGRRSEAGSRGREHEGRARTSDLRPPTSAPAARAAGGNRRRADRPGGPAAERHAHAPDDARRDHRRGRRDRHDGGQPGGVGGDPVDRQEHGRQHPGRCPRRSQGRIGPLRHEGQYLDAGGRRGDGPRMSRRRGGGAHHQLLGAIGLRQPLLESHRSHRQHRRLPQDAELEPLGAGARLQSSARCSAARRSA